MSEDRRAPRPENPTDEVVERLQAAFPTQVPAGLRNRHLVAMDRALGDGVSPGPGMVAVKRALPVLVVGLAVGGPVGAVAAESALPGDGLYPVKRVAESVRAVFDGDVVARHRVDEVEALALTVPGFTLDGAQESQPDDADVAPESDVVDRLVSAATDAVEATDGRLETDDLRERAMAVADQVSVAVVAETLAIPVPAQVRARALRLGDEVQVRREAAVLAAAERAAAERAEAARLAEERAEAVRAGQEQARQDRLDAERLAAEEERARLEEERRATEQPSPRPTVSDRPSPTPTRSPAPSPTPTRDAPPPSPSPSPSPSPTPTRDTLPPSPSPSPSPSPTPTRDAPSPSPSPSPTPSPTPTRDTPPPSPSPKPTPTSDQPAQRNERYAVRQAGAVVITVRADGMRLAQIEVDDAWSVRVDRSGEPNRIVATFVHRRDDRRLVFTARHVGNGKVETSIREEP